MAEKQEPKVPGTAPAGGKSRLKLIIVSVLAVLLVVGASVGATWFFLNKGAAEHEAGPAREAARVAPVKQQAIYEPLMPAFVVNFRQENGRQHYMQVSITLMGRDQAEMDRLKEQLPVLRNQLVMLFSSQNFATLLTPDGKEQLRQQATSSLQALARKILGQPVIEQVLFTNLAFQ